MCSSDSVIYIERFFFRFFSLVLHPLVRLFATPWTVACQAPLSVEFSRQQNWNGLPCPPPGHLPDPGIEPTSPALAGRLAATRDAPRIGGGAQLGPQQLLRSLHGRQSDFPGGSRTEPPHRIRHPPWGWAKRETQRKDARTLGTGSGEGEAGAGTRRALSPFGAGAARPRSWRQRTVCAPGPEHSPGAHGGTQRSTQQSRSPVSAELFRARFLTAELQTLVLQVSL